MCKEGDRAATLERRAAAAEGEGAADMDTSSHSRPAVVSGLVSWGGVG